MILEINKARYIIYKDFSGYNIANISLQLEQKPRKQLNLELVKFKISFEILQDSF